MIRVDNPTTQIPTDAHTKRAGSRHAQRWSHLWADPATPENIEKLHQMAQKIGLKKEWFQNRAGFPHYDVTPPKRTRSIQLGAIPSCLKTWIKEKRTKNEQT